MKILFLACMMMVIGRTYAQVESDAYNVLLKTILSHSVPEVPVDKVEQSGPFILLDAREAREFNVSHLKGARYVGYEDFTIDSLKTLDKSTPLLVYCSIGLRSEKVAQKLKAAGFTDVSNLYGGIFEWVNQGYPIVDQNGTETTYIHGYSRAWAIWLKKGDKLFPDE